jgi:hypothetical protein
MAKTLDLVELSSMMPSRIDVFVCATSFERRSLSIPTALARHDVRRVVMFSDNEIAGETGVAVAESIAGMFPGRTSQHFIKLRDPLDIANKMIQALMEHVRAAAEVVIDVTTFTHEALLILLRVIQIFGVPDVRFTGVYTGASEYAIGLAPEDKWLTKGVLDIRSILGFSGESIPTQGQHLIVLAGFELERAERIIDAYEPNLLSIGLGDPLESISSTHFSVNQWFHRKLLERYTTVKQFVFSCDDVTHTRDAILQQARSLPGYNVLVAPLNTKISTVGAGLAALEDPGIQLCYAVTEQYNRDGYSSPSDSVYIFPISPPSEKASQ